VPDSRWWSLQKHYGALDSGCCRTLSCAWINTSHGVFILTPLQLGFAGVDAGRPLGNQVSFPHLDALECTFLILCFPCFHGISDFKVGLGLALELICTLRYPWNWALWMLLGERISHRSMFCTAVPALNGHFEHRLSQFQESKFFCAQLGCFAGGPTCVFGLPLVFFPSCIPSTVPLCMPAGGPSLRLRPGVFRQAPNSQNVQMRSPGLSAGLGWHFRRHAGNFGFHTGRLLAPLGQIHLLWAG
jgi:hypothetical protein